MNTRAEGGDDIQIQFERGTRGGVRGGGRGGGGDEMTIRGECAVNHKRDRTVRSKMNN